MLEKLISGYSVKKTNIYCLILIAIYAVYAFFANNPLIEDEVLLLESPNITYFIFVPISLLIIGITYWGILKRKWTSINTGFKLGKVFWIIFGVSIIILISIIVDRPQVYTLKAFIQLIPLLLFMTGSEIVLRILLINRLEKIIKNPGWFYQLAAVISGILFSVVHIQMAEITYILIIGSIVLSFLYIYSRSLLVIVFADLTLYTNIQYTLAMAIMVIILYFMIALSAKMLERRRGASLQVE